MKAITLSLLLFGFVQYGKGQMPDKILITDRSRGLDDIRLYKYEIIKIKNEYHLFQLLEHVDGDREEKIDSSKRFLYKISNLLIDSLTHELKNKNFSSYKFEHFGYTQEWVTSHLDEITKPIKKERSYWNDLQMSFICSRLADIKNHKNAIGKRVYNDMKVDSKKNLTVFIATFYFGQKKVTLKSRGNLFGFPWFVGSNLSFNPAFPRLFNRLLPDNYSINQVQFDAINTLFYYSSINMYYDQHWEEKLKELAVLEFKNELQELKDSFNIIQVDEYGYGGRYIWPTNQTFRVTLKGPKMKNQVFIQFFITKQHNALYSRDSILRNANDAVNRIQNIDFLMKYIRGNPLRKVEISFFDDRTFNDYNIEHFNQNPKRWEIYDMKLEKDSSVYELRNIYCGCNFRLDSNYLSKSIFFELFEENGDGSIWVLLPDNTPVLWFFQGEKAFKYKYDQLSSDGKYIHYPCKKFDKFGNLFVE